MGAEAIGYLLGQQCAPVIAGIKPSNLLIVERGNHQGLQHALRGTELYGYLLYTSSEKDYWFLYDPNEFKNLLADAEKEQYLRKFGYNTDDMEAVLARLSVRFGNYKKKGSEFPHEMGVLFGYPLKDVKGFIENNGQNFKMSGYWKVYDDVSYAGRIFRLYECVRKTALELCNQGMGIPDIWKSFRMAGNLYS